MEEEEELTEYNLASIEESSENNSTGKFESSNLNDLVKETDLSTLGTKTETTFKINDFTEYNVFNLDNVKNITSKDYHFDFTLNGNLKKELQADSLPVSIPLNQINKSVDCTFNIKPGAIADLKCNLNLEEYKNNFNEFSLKVTEVKDSSDNPIYLSRINEVKLIHQEEEDDDGINVAVVVGIVVAAVVVAGGGVGVGIFLYKAHKLKKLLKNNANDNSVKENINKAGGDSHRKIIPFQN